MADKRVVAVIVEGPSDESAIGGILKEYFSSDETWFVVAHGDITSRKGINPSNVVSKLKALVDEVRVRYGYNWRDFVRIIHIADTDGSFTKDSVIKSNVESVLYYEDHMETANVEEIENRNLNKAAVLFRLYSTAKINKVDYRIYFNSCNLEHVLYNALKNFTDDEKEEMSDEFAEKYEGRLQDFIAFISAPDIAVSGTYKETWKYIEKDKNSLQRHTNMHLIFE